MRKHLNRISVLTLAFLALSGIIVLKLFQLQIVDASYYRDIADRNHRGNTELPARRGEIMILDSNSSEEYRIATNITLDLLFADPSQIKNKEYIVETLTPLLYDPKEAKEEDKARIATAITKAKNEEELNQIKALSEVELAQNFKNQLLEKISRDKKNYVLLFENPSPELREKIESFKLSGIYANEKEIYANPLEITNPERYALQLSPYLDIKVVKLKSLLFGKNRYIILKKKVRPEISTKIKELIKKEPEKLFGIDFKEEYYRYYPEKQLMAQVVGFVDHTNKGQSGIEAYFDKEMAGENGIFISQKDGAGNQITVGESTIKPAIDGADIVLTIDRTIQTEVEKKLEEAVKSSKSDQGQIIIMDPQTGAIKALAHYPTYNPNSYGDVFDKKDFNLTEEEKKSVVKVGEKNVKYYFYVDREKDEKYELFPKVDTENKNDYQVYKNLVGPGAYRNRVVSDIYEPGSVFKIFTMASGLDSKEVTPFTRVEEKGPIDVDFNVITKQFEHKIKNALDRYRGNINMTEVLQYSSNIGISFVAKKLGKALFYDYIQKFGFGKKTYITLPNEENGRVSHYSDWSESQHLTTGFGQGITATPMQVISALSSIANGGVMMQPRIVEEIRKKTDKGLKTEKNEAKILGRTVTKETADTLTAMLVNTVENGIQRARAEKHYLAGKTGTSQTYKNGKPLTGAGTTIASMAGFGPIKNPKFVILIKIDKPRTDEWGVTVAGPLFKDLSEFLFDYYNIPPDKN